MLYLQPLFYWANLWRVHFWALGSLVLPLLSVQPLSRYLQREWYTVREWGVCVRFGIRW